MFQCHDALQASELELQMEVERMVVQELALEQQHAASSSRTGPDILSVHDHSRHSSVSRSSKASRKTPRQK